jgi:hypothetical protein
MFFTPIKKYEIIWRKYSSPVEAVEAVEAVEGWRRVGER